MLRQNNLVLIHSCFIWIILVNSSVTNDIFIDMKRYLLKGGFHRDLETELSIKVIDLVFPQGVDSSKCSALLVETLPPGLYADPFQLSWLFDNNGATQVLTDSYVDVEKAAHLSEEHILFLYLALPPRLSYQDTITLKVSLPIHVRYHPPSPDPQVSFANVTLSYPHVLLNCSRSGCTLQWNSCWKEEARDTVVVILTISKKVEAPCDWKNTSVCLWEETSIINEFKHILTITVPVGRQTDTFLVIFGTVIVTIMGCTVVLYTIAFYQYPAAADKVK